MVWCITMLSWPAVDFAYALKSNGEYDNTLVALRWGTDYLIKADPEPDVLYGHVGDEDSDHACWLRPEDMRQPFVPFSKSTPRIPALTLPARHPLH
ncbi:unnamed protein product [Rhodiola kirilowii]